VPSNCSRDLQSLPTTARPRLQCRGILSDELQSVSCGNKTLSLGSPGNLACHWSGSAAPAARRRLATGSPPGHNQAPIGTAELLSTIQHPKVTEVRWRPAKRGRNGGTALGNMLHLEQAPPAPAFGPGLSVSTRAAIDIDKSAGGETAAHQRHRCRTHILGSSSAADRKPRCRIGEHALLVGVAKAIIGRRVEQSRGDKVNARSCPTACRSPGWRGSLATAHFCGKRREQPPSDYKLQIGHLATAIFSAVIFVAVSSFRVGLSFDPGIFPLGFQGVFAGGFWCLGRKSLG